MSVCESEKFRHRDNWIDDKFYFRKLEKDQKRPSLLWTWRRLIRVTESGLINTFKLVHRSGSLKCRNKASASYWGFAQVEDKLITLITFKNRTALLLAEYGRYTQGCNYYSYPILTAWMSTRQNLRSTIFLLQCLWRRLGKSSKFGLQETWSTAVKTVTVLSRVEHVLMFMKVCLNLDQAHRDGLWKTF